MRRSAWTQVEKVDFVRWHERRIAEYPEVIQIELRRARTKWLAGVPLTSASDTPYRRTSTTEE